MTAPDLYAADPDRVKRHLLNIFSERVSPLLDAAAAGSLSSREAERQTWTVVVHLGAMLLTALFSAMCRKETERAVEGLGLDILAVPLRMDRDYFTTLKTTFGPVLFPWFAFRSPDGVTQVPARKRFPLYPRMRVSEVLLEWEAALAADHPFRKAADALLFFTHQAVHIEDTTVENHAVIVGAAIPRSWQYRSVAEIRRLLQERATRDTLTGRPIIYASTDAHALTRFVDDTWAAAWKMINGIRLWCIDAKTAETIHLGGEYTWGDCEEVARRFKALQDEGQLPANGDYGQGLLAQIALVSDGSAWIASRVVPLFPGAEAILDPFHVIEHIADAARLIFKKEPAKVKKLVREAQKALGFREQRPRATKRKGPRRPKAPHPPTPPTAGASKLGDIAGPLLRKIRRGPGYDRLFQALEFIEQNVERMDYGRLRARGFLVGSGAMESLHRTASQLRLKRPGCRWTANAAQAILNLRMLQLSGRWNEWWNQPDLPARLAAKEAT